LRETFTDAFDPSRDFGASSSNALLSLAFGHLPRVTGRKTRLAARIQPWSFVSVSGVIVREIPCCASSKRHSVCVAVRRRHSPPRNDLPDISRFEKLSLGSVARGTDVS
jgi:hypothetical protein